MFLKILIFSSFFFFLFFEKNYYHTRRLSVSPSCRPSVCVRMSICPSAHVAGGNQLFCGKSKFNAAISRNSITNYAADSCKGTIILQRNLCARFRLIYKPNFGEN